MSSLIYIGAGNGNSALAQQFFDRLIAPPTGVRESLYADLINELSGAGIWSKLDFLQIYASAYFPTGAINLTSSSCTASWPEGIGTITIPDTGVTPLGGPNYLDTGFNFSTATNFKQNDASLFAWNLTTTPQPGFMCGTDESHISPYNNNASNHTLWAINSSSEVDSGAVASNASGFWLVNRTGVNASAIYRNGSQLGTSSVSSVAPTNATLTFASNNTCQIMAAGAGASLSVAQISQLYNTLQDYAQSIAISV